MHQQQSREWSVAFSRDGIMGIAQCASDADPSHVVACGDECTRCVACCSAAGDEWSGCGSSPPPSKGTEGEPPPSPPPPPSPSDYVSVVSGVCEAPILDADECGVAARSLGYTFSRVMTYTLVGGYPCGCLYMDGGEGRDG